MENKKRIIYMLLQRNKDKKFDIDEICTDRKTALENLAVKDMALLIEVTVIGTIGE